MLLAIFFVIVSLLGGGLLFLLIYPKLQILADRYSWTENTIFIMAVSVTVVASMFGLISESVNSDVIAKVMYFTFVFLWGFSICVGVFLRER
ncbi:hypothetical protein RJD11_02605 [Bacillus velezensis]|uniref:hypothetical protein n=1 Tax=Bacillus TaxID=1386 RepID=UPI0002A11DB2|nr:MULTISPECIES: hypothetical protein [Bacillus amyloliquefaciens group]AFZ89504.1 hypothetical protein B938_02340 [Bacillus velezensis AS43.3]MCP1565398.1 hypothetical protein [Bacillus velezensis]MEC1136338.1 hypothetical protein [Bacillus velezensis]MEC1701536.1 hypothetical protein [Bacillus velezensis]ODB62258.1 hypothetical protein A7313_19910 [Bacillus velezensis]